MSSSTSLSDVPELAKRIQTVSNELMALHSELYWMALEEQSDSQQEQFGNLDIHMVTDFKFAVDNMRDLLWKYLEVAGKVEPQRVQEAADAHRARRVTQLLHLLRERLGRDADAQPA